MAGRKAWLVVEDGAAPSTPAGVGEGFEVPLAATVMWAAGAVARAASVAQGGTVARLTPAAMPTTARYAPPPPPGAAYTLAPTSSGVIPMATVAADHAAEGMIALPTPPAGFAWRLADARTTAAAPRAAAARQAAPPREVDEFGDAIAMVRKVPLASYLRRGLDAGRSSLLDEPDSESTVAGIDLTAVDTEVGSRQVYDLRTGRFRRPVNLRGGQRV